MMKMKNWREPPHNAVYITVQVRVLHDVDNVCNIFRVLNKITNLSISLIPPGGCFESSQNFEKLPVR